MSTVKAKNFQIGISPTAAHNYTWQVPATPDGSLKLSRGNAGGTTADVLVIDAAGVMTLPGLDAAGLPISTATQAALNNKATMTAANGIQLPPQSGLALWQGSITVDAFGTGWADFDSSGGRPVIQTLRNPGDSAIWWIRHAVNGVGYACGIAAYNMTGTAAMIRIRAGSTYFDFAGNTAAMKPGGGAWADNSDERVKENIQDWNVGLKEILALRPVIYNFREETGRDPERKHVSLIAQEAETVIPRLVDTRPATLGEMEFEDMRFLDPSDLPYALINAVSELSKQVEELKAEIQALKSGSL